MVKLHFKSSDNKGINPKEFVDNVVLNTEFSLSTKREALRFACDLLNAPKNDIEAFYCDCLQYIN